MKELSLKEIFFPSPAKGADGEKEGFGNLIEQDSKKSDEVLAALRRDLKKQLPRLSFKTVAEEMEAQLEKVLDIGLEEVFGTAWTKYKGFQEYADPQKHPPEETALVPLASHKIESAHAPHVDLIVKNIEIGRLQLEVHLALELDGVILKIQGGRIREIRAGSCKASGSLNCTLNSKIGVRELLKLDRATPKFELTAFDLGEGLEIPVVKAPDLSELAQELEEAVSPQGDGTLSV